MSVPPQPGLQTVITSDTNPPAEKLFTQAEVAEALAKARKEEKDKLYPDIASLKDQFAQSQKTIAELAQQREEDIAAATRKKQEKESAAKAKQEEEMSAKDLLEAKLRETNDTWEKRFTNLQAERDQEKALADKERKYNELVSYRNTRLAELSKEIAPEFHDFISGESQEQIEAAIARAQAGTQSILAGIQQATQQVPPRGVSPTGYTGFGPLDSAGGPKQLSAEDINAMSLAEYGEWRNKNGMAAKEATRSRGLFN
jgi:hypothetical protein